MDAYDIFKKLTKGLKFKTRTFGIHNNLKTQNLDNQKDKKEVLEVKKEELSENEEGLELSGDESETHSKSDSESAPSDNDEDLKIIDGADIGMKKRNRKSKEKTEDLKKKLELEKQNQFRNEFGIKAVGRHIAPALKDFADLQTRYNVSDALIKTVIKCGYTEPTPIQRQALPCMMEDRQILACAPTGSGKTAAFLLPVLHTLGAPRGGPRALVLCPTRELAVQIYGEALRLSEGTELRCSVVRKMQESKIKERESTIRKSDIVISTPNRLCYLLNQDNVGINLDKVRWLIIDEADKLFEGSSEQESDFRQQIHQIMQACSSRDRRICMFSATHAASVAQWARRNLRGLINITIGHRNAAAETVQQELLYCGSESGKLIAFRQLIQKGLNPPVLVFVQSKDRAKQLFKELIYDGINVDVIHADRTQTQRDNVVRSFRLGRIWVLICTELLGRGIDFRGVHLVLNYDFPPSAVAYIHRIGRAGRAGQKGKAITFFTQDDVVNLRSIAAVMKQSGCEVPEYMLKLKKDQGARKRLLKRAPRRDDISTVLGKKRKLEEGTDSKEDISKSTQMVKDAKYKKHKKSESPGQFVKVNNNKKKNQEVKNKQFGKRNKEDDKQKKQLGKRNKQNKNKQDGNIKGKLNKKQKKTFVAKINVKKAKNNG